MKKIIAFSVIVVSLICLILVFGGNTASAETEYLRIHVRANSNEKCDQNIKYIVKDEVVKFITPYVSECVDKQTAMEVMGNVIPEIEKVCDKTLSENGYNYKSKAQIRAEKFPTRVYGDLTLDEGVYDALIIELGEGVGDNWWCVIYPPLCFTSSTTDVVYRSKILEIIQSFMN